MLDKCFEWGLRSSGNLNVCHVYPFLSLCTIQHDHQEHFSGNGGSDTFDLSFAQNGNYHY